MDQRGYTGYTSNERQNSGFSVPGLALFPLCLVVFREPENKVVQIKKIKIKNESLEKANRWSEGQDAI